MIKIDNNSSLIFESIQEYCERFNIPIENLIDILEDQKVLPMIRGKATEYIAAAILKRYLSKEWQIQKLNLNPQPNSYDEDISITHSRTGKRMKVEAKNAVRGSFKIGSSKTKVKEPHFRVKCHKSRSNIELASTTNDRYLIQDFDLLVCNVSNAIFQGRTLGKKLELIGNNHSIDLLKKFYNVESDEDLIRKCYDDWRFCFPQDISDDGISIPRTPAVKLSNDTNWKSVADLEEKLLPQLRRVIAAEK